MTRRVDWENPVSDHPLNLGLVSRWQVGEDNPYWGGARLLDLAGSNHGELTNFAATANPWTAALGRPGGFGAVYLSGSVDCVISAITPLAATGKLTASMWLRSGGNDASVLSYPFGVFEQAASQTFGIFAGGFFLNYGIGFIDNPTGNIANTGANTFLDANVQNKWKHLTVVYDKDAATKTSFYLDGLPVATTADAVTGDIGANGNRVILGGRNVGSFPWKGNMDDVRFWYGRALSADDAFEVYDDSRLGSPATLNYRSSSVFFFRHRKTAPHRKAVRRAA